MAGADRRRVVCRRRRARSVRPRPVLALGAARRSALGEIGDRDARDAAQAVWRSVFGDLRTALLLIAIAGTIVVAAARSLLRVARCETPAGAARGARDDARPTRTVPRVARALALVVAGVIALVDPSLVLDTLLFGAGLLLVGSASTS